VCGESVPHAWFWNGSRAGNHPTDHNLGGPSLLQFLLYFFKCLSFLPKPIELLHEEVVPRLFVSRKRKMGAFVRGSTTPI